MSTIANEPLGATPQKRRWPTQFVVREMWVSLAIAVMWVAVLFDAVFGPDIVSTSGATNTTTIPSAVVVALFALLGTRVVAKYGFGPHEEEPD